MDKHPPNLVQNLKNALKTKDFYPQNPKGISILAFICSIFIYISIFYIFNLSPSRLLHNNKFWFLISNTLILILVVDYEYFSKYNIYDEYSMKNIRIHPCIPTLKSHTPPPDQITTKHTSQEVLFHSGKGLHHLRSLPPLRRSHVQDTLVDSTYSLYKKPQEKPRALKHHHKHHHGSSHHHNKKKNESSPEIVKRSRSDVTKRVVIDESRNIVRRIEMDYYYEPSDYSDQDVCYDDDDQEECGKNEYANLSTEELNRRVEDFIQHFNMQIRLQAN